MARKLIPELIAELKTGRFKKLLSQIASDPELSFEVRTKGEAKVYYSKGLILTLSAKKEPQLLAKGYLKNRAVPDLDLYAPAKYLSAAKEVVRAHSKKLEFSIQQNIAQSNRNVDSEFFIVDMEYQFPQDDIPKEDRLNDKTRIDLVGIERKTGDIVLFELKQGSAALSGKSGADDHFRKMAAHIRDERFCQAIKADISTVIADKKELGLLPYNVPEPSGSIRMMYIFAYNNDRDLIEYEKKYAPRYSLEGVSTLYIDTRYKLSSE